MAAPCPFHYVARDTITGGIVQKRDPVTERAIPLIAALQEFKTLGRQVREWQDPTAFHLDQSAERLEAACVMFESFVDAVMADVAFNAGGSFRTITSIVSEDGIADRIGHIQNLAAALRRDVR